MRRARGAWSLAAVLLVLTALHVWGRARGSTKTPSPPSRSDAFGSLQACRTVLGAGQRLPRPPGTARFASWNLRWFPDGEPGVGDRKTDLPWLACALSWLDVDVLAVQEIKQTPSADRALGELLLELNQLSGGRYVARLDDCGTRVPQHVGLVWNAARVSATSVETVAALNPKGAACQDQLRPGLSARVALPGGLDLTVISAHFKSKADPRAFSLRGESFRALPDAMADLATRAGDQDTLLLGDLNTMGCQGCAPPVSAQEEQAKVREQLRREGFSLIPADATGTQVYRGRPALLDHAVVAVSMRELPAAARVHVSGACGASDEARKALSDHCPIVLDLTDQDLD